MSRLTLGMGVGLASFASPVAISAQEVVQALPPAGVADLNEALRRLSRNELDLGALIAAGNASLDVGDIDAAIGFFGRAKELAPDDSRIKVGLAAAYMRSERPMDALRLFSEAEAAGASTSLMAADRALAYDLVGDNGRAQENYRRALQARPQDKQLLRKLALSQAIAGNRIGFEATLRPLLDQRDFGAYRSRAFGLAILGEVDDAIAIADAVMPRNLAKEIAPYLRTMPRLTPAQQAAAANFGIFPEASEIGRDDPRIAAFAGTKTPLPSQADRRLAPTGPALGTASGPADAAPRTSSSTARTAPTPAARPARQASGNTRRDTSGNRALAAQRRADERRLAAERVSRQEARNRAAQVATEPSRVPAATSATTTSQAVSATALPDVATRELPAASTSTSQQTVTFRPVTASPERSDAATPSIDLAQGSEPIASFELPASVPASTSASALATDNSSGTRAAEPVVIASGSQISEPSVLQRPNAAPPTAANPPASTTASVADAFANFDLKTAGSTPGASDAVDITKIEAPRETSAAIPKAVAAEPDNAARIWVQVATGRARDALRFDWRRIQRGSDGVLDGKSAFVAQWGQTNRLLTGPYETGTAARAAINALAAAGIDSFMFESVDGQAVDPLGR
ncbi:SPOR domain-containing protein [Alteripontixanthobacter maritimus]|uniref:SPOR domain-containing protein n=1 Tax=Alteripontixanthobacter maritimus TaxID=2161824 RepID=UPI0015F08F21|nr:SPOR domain-containing protein [Alteripontixanthobacter maritimus]